MEATSQVEIDKRKLLVRRDTSNKVSSRYIDLRKTSIRSSVVNGFGPLQYALVLFTFLLLISISSCQPAQLSVARYSLAAAGAGNKIVFAGGLDSSGLPTAVVDVYDVTSDTWNSTSTGAGQLSVARSSLAAASAGNKLVFAGGRGVSSVSSTVDIFDAVSGVWNSTATGAGQLSVPRDFLVAAAIGNIVVFAGGRNGSFGLPITTVDIYDVIAGTWNSTSMGAGQLSVARSELAAAAAGGKVVFAGGRLNPTNATTAVATVDIYDINTGAWTYIPAGLSVARFSLAAASAGNKIVFAGGLQSSFGYSSVVDIYDAITAVWTSMSSLGTGLSIKRYSLAAARLGTKAVFAGGLNSMFLDTVDVYDSSTNQLVSAADGAGLLSIAKADFAGAAAGSVLLFAGGRANFSLNGVSNTVDKYDAQGMNVASTTLATTTSTRAVTTSTVATTTTTLATILSTTLASLTTESVSTTALTSTTSEATVSTFIATTIGSTTTVAATTASTTTTALATEAASTTAAFTTTSATTAAAFTSTSATTAAAFTSTSATTTAAFTTTLATTISTGGGSSKLSTGTIAGISVAAAVVAVGILIGVGILLGWNRQLIASVHELRMMRIIRERKQSMDLEL